jgi:hypothetical protein
MLGATFDHLMEAQLTGGGKQAEKKKGPKKKGPETESPQATAPSDPERAGSGFGDGGSANEAVGYTVSCRVRQRKPPSLFQLFHAHTLSASCFSFPSLPHAHTCVSLGRPPDRARTLPLCLAWAPYATACAYALERCMRANDVGLRSPWCRTLQFLPRPACNATHARSLLHTVLPAPLPSLLCPGPCRPKTSR